MSNADGEPDKFVTIRCALTRSQLSEINRRAGLGPFDGRARSAYIVDCLFDEQRDELLERVHEIRNAERARFRAEIEAERAARQ